jgi:phosphopentomutase
LSAVSTPAPSWRRAILLVLDSLGVGELPDAAAYGDAGSNTLGNVARRVTLHIPALRGLGLCQVIALPGIDAASQPAAAFGRMAEASAGKDSVTGHWEIAGIVLDRPFPVFPDGFPAVVIAEFESRIGRPTIANAVGSGTEMIARYGEEHVRTGAPIVYTSADSVFQIAAHEAVIPLPDLYDICSIAYDIVCTGMGVGRVIARPFVGTPGTYARTSNRRDFVLPAPAETLLDRLTAAGIPVIAIGKIEDLFAGRGISKAVHTAGDDDVMDEVDRAMETADRGLIFANLVDFDTLYGHRNDPRGYAANLERFDARLSEVLPRLRPDDLLIVTADHGNDPTTPSTDHSREYVPLLVVGRGVRSGTNLGVRSTFADLGQTLAELFGVGPLPHGASFFRELCAGAEANS